VREVQANLADRERWWQRLRDLLSVARAVPWLAVIRRWAASAGVKAERCSVSSASRTDPGCDRPDPALAQLEHRLR
jgi:hypothetical protein